MTDQTTKRAHEPIEVNDVNSTVEVPHLGITLRVLIGACLSGWPRAHPGEKRTYNVLYKSADIGTINVRQHTDFETH